MNLGAKGTIRPLRAAVARRRSGPGPRPGLRPRHVTPERLWREAAAGAGPGAGPGRAEAAGDSGAGAESGAGPPSATTSESEDESEHSSEAEEAEENEAEEERTSAAGSEKEEADEEEEEYDEEEEEEEDDNRAAKKPRHGGFILDEADVDDKYEGEDILEEGEESPHAALGAPLGLCGGPSVQAFVAPSLAPFPILEAGGRGWKRSPAVVQLWGGQPLPSSSYAPCQAPCPLQNSPLEGGWEGWRVCLSVPPSRCPFSQHISSALAWGFYFAFIPPHCPSSPPRATL
ncbi:uncharacterized protein LOC141974155 isoform X1 [Athene noctua]|uniref:uncharacterized protein LOC141974155 isoform X1 n=1 Tax=Athene noctua TaxID=126797 RepID=UPI003EBF50AB